MLKSISFKTKFGWIGIIEENQVIISISFGKIIERGSSKELVKLKRDIKDYFLGKKIKWTLLIKLSGTILQKKIWKELKKIPYGETRSYGQIAKKLKTSPRFVGNVCGQNKHLIIIPCHRVIKTNGELGGFSGLGGIKVKKRLLTLEND